MSNITIPSNFGAVSSVFGPYNARESELSAGIATGFAVIGYRGKVWSIKHQGNERPLMREDGDGARGSIEIVILRGAQVKSKIFYENGFVDGSTASPDCWSSNGVTPDPMAAKKQHRTCAGCPQDAWGARVTEQGKPGKACSDSKRLAVVPVGDLQNEMFGGPMLLRVPAASLKDLVAYDQKLGALGYPPYAVATRVSFDVSLAYPKFVFGAIRALTDEEALQVKALRDDPRVYRILAEGTDMVAQELEAPSAASVFEQPPAPAPAPVVVAAPAPAPAPAPVVEALPAHDPVTGEVTEEKEEEEDEEAALLAKLEAARKAKAAAKKAAPKAAAPAPAPEVTAAPAPVVAAPAAFEALLDGLL